MQTRHRALFFVLIFGLLLAACGGAGPEEIPPLTASMSELEGTVLIRKSGEENMQFAADQKLEQNDQIVTGDDGRVRLDLSTGSIVRIAPSSMFTLLTSGAGADGVNTTMQLDAGSLWLILNGGSAEVETPSGVASVRGSYLMVSVLPSGGVYLTCLEGDCRIRNNAGEYFLTTGESATVINAATAPIIGRMTPEEVEEWLEFNPEAILVIPSLTATLQATATTEPESTATTAPSQTPVPSPSNTPVPSPTPFPTAVPSSTVKPKPPADDPPPAPTATDTPVPSNWGYSVSNVLINGGNNIVNINASFPVSFDFTVWNDPSCPGCIDQLVVGLDSTSTYCAYNGIPAIYPGGTAGSNVGNLTAPSVPGTYDVVVHQDLQFSCANAVAANAGFGSQVIGTITVVIP